jgi:SOS-response transcriptional repressor LexA
MSTKARPEWADRLERLRQTLGISQAGLARRLHVSAMAPSRWERGINEPPAEIYIQLGKMVGEPACWYFWEKAGLKKVDVLAVSTRTKKNAATKMAVAPTPSAVIPSVGLRNTPTTTHMCAIPLYTTSAEGKIDRDNTAEVITAPKDWCKHPDDTYCIRLRNETMAPVLRDGTIVAVDQRERDKTKLDGKMVLASHPQKGIVIHWLQRVNGAEMLVPENREHPAIYLAEGSWALLGKVVWWIAKAP